MRSFGSLNKKIWRTAAGSLLMSCLAAAMCLESLAEEGTGLPKRYDLREHGRFPVIYDQGNQGTCWAFASLSALVTSMEPGTVPILSADHMVNKNAFRTSYEAGGDCSVSSAYLLSWQGPVRESEDPEGDGVSPDGLKPICHVQEIRYPGEKDYTAIKRAICESGGVQSSLYLPAAWYEERKSYYREDTSSLYYDGQREANHDIVIVGWDDGYSRENFAKTPASDGAFLCVNSWGTEFGRDGFFYVSYEDTQIGRYNASYSGIEASDNYDTVYQTDLCGWTGQLGYGDPDVWISNVYRAETDETIAAAGFYSLVPGTSYRLYVVPVPDAEAAEKTLEASLRKESRRPLAEGTVPDTGYYTVPFPDGVSVGAGQRFAVAAELSSPGTAQPAAIEYRGEGRTANVDISDGEGYISPDGAGWERAEERLECNICLKAYSKRQ